MTDEDPRESVEAAPEVVQHVAQNQRPICWHWRWSHWPKRDPALGGVVCLGVRLQRGLVVGEPSFRLVDQDLVMQRGAVHLGPAVSEQWIRHALTVDRWTASVNGPPAGGPLAATN